jgi:hypothetical protein
VRRSVLLVAAACAALAAAAPVLSMGAPNKWDNIQTGLTYRLYHPTNTLHQKRNSLKTISCGKGKEPWVAATYGTYKGVLNTKTKGFGLYEGHPICANAGTSSPIKAPTIKGSKGKVYAGVYCNANRTCTKRQGYGKGFTVQWTMARSGVYHKDTQMQVDSAHMRWKQLVRFIHSLKPVG